MKWYQISLRGILGLVTGSCAGCSVFVWFGSSGIAILAVLLLVAVLWAFLFNLAPEATKYLTVLAVLGLPLLALLAMGLARARENAQWTQSGYHLGNYAREAHEKANFRPLRP